MLNATLYYSGSGGLVMRFGFLCRSGSVGICSAKVVGLPVYKLLGGAVRDEIQFLRHRCASDLAKDGLYRWQNADALGGHMMAMRGSAKMPLWSRICVKKCGEDFWLILDCWMSQDVNYATKTGHACAPYNLKWIEECLPPQQLKVIAN